MHTFMHAWVHVSPFLFPCFEGLISWFHGDGLDGLDHCSTFLSLLAHRHAYAPQPTVGCGTRSLIFLGSTLCRTQVKRSCGRWWILKLRLLSAIWSWTPLLVSCSTPTICHLPRRCRPASPHPPGVACTRNSPAAAALRPTACSVRWGDHIAE